MHLKIVVTSKYLGVLPTSLGSMDQVDWVPVDIFENIIVELAGADGVQKTYDLDSSTIPVYHAVKPSPTDWSKFVHSVTEHLGQSVKIVSWSEWLDVLRNSQDGATLSKIQQTPGLKLLNFFESLERAVELGKQSPILETKKTVVKSMTMASLEAVGEKWMEIWLKQWGF